MSDIGPLDDRARANQRLIFEAEKEASRKVETARKRANQVIQEEEIRLNSIKDEYSKQNEMERIRSEAQLENTKLKGYENVRMTQKMMDQEKRRIQKEGESEVARVDSHFNEQVYRENVEGSKKLDEIRHKNFQLEEFERRKASQNDQSYRAEHTGRVSQLKQDQDAAFAKMAEETAAHYTATKEMTDLALLDTEDKFKKQFQDTALKQKAVLARANQDATQKLLELQKTNTDAIAGYSERSADPFYRLTSFNAETIDKGDHFEIRAMVPEHERRGLAVTVQGQSLILSGHRQNKESFEPEPGRLQTTSSYQAFTETLPLSYPVEPRLLSRDVEGDEVVIRVPKKTTYSPQHVAKAPEKIKIDRPRFPENLPKPTNLEHEDPKLAEQDALSEKLARKSLNS